MENKHTPLPWKIEPVCMGGRGKYAIYRPCVSADNKIIADMTWPAIDGTEFEKAERKANGKLIIEAVNSYESMKAQNAELLAALKECVGIIANESKLTETACKGLDETRATIAKYEVHK